MKLLAFTDLHANLRAIEHLAQESERHKVDFLVCAGDFSMFGNGQEQMLKELNAIGKPIILIHGNHEHEDLLEHQISKYKNIIWVHKDTYEYQNFIFIGFGGGGFATHEPEFKSFAAKHAKRKNIILVTHQPPYGTALDELYGDYVGNKDFRSFIEDAKPLVAICGHIHENQNKHSVVSKTLVINPGPMGKILEIEEQDAQKK
ncbi:MAG TPA: metallophosphoesterase [Acidobacteriota bacterium]|nr:metallophosphoesterase [Acidobacteriota bacterium]